MFVTFLEDVEQVAAENPGETYGPFEEGQTVELPEEAAEIFLENGNAVEYAWKCGRCGELHKQRKKPVICQSPNCDIKTAFKPLHPVEHFEQGEALIENYNFATIQESVKASKGVGKIFVQRNGVFTQTGAEGLIRKRVKELDPTSKNRQENEVAKYIETETQRPEEEFGLELGKVAVENGILDIEAGQLEDFTPEKLAISKIPHEYDPDAGCEQWIKFVKELIPNKSERKTFQEFLGTALVNEKLHKKMCILVGPTDAGKSTIIKVLRGVLGSENVSNQSMHELTYTRWAKNKIFGKLLNAADETSTNRLKSLDTLKRLGDGNELTGEEKGKPTYEFTPTCEHIFAANQSPDAERNDDAFWNRWIVIETPRTLKQEEQNPDIHKELIEEASGILNWIIGGYQRFIEQDKKFTDRQEWTEVREKWLNWGSALQRFIQQYVRHEPENKVAAREIYESCVNFAEENGLSTPSSQKKVTEEVKKLPYAAYSENYMIGGEKRRGFKGIKLVHNTDNTHTPIHSQKRENKDKENKTMSELTKDRVNRVEPLGTDGRTRQEKEKTVKELAEKLEAEENLSKDTLKQEAEAEGISSEFVYLCLRNGEVIV